MGDNCVTRRPTRCPVTISVIGAGHVGAIFTYALLLSGMAVEVVLVDKDAARARSEALDLSHALPFRVPANIRAGTLDDTACNQLVANAAKGSCG